LVGDVRCTAADDALSYLVVARRRAAVVCPWDAVPLVVHVYVTSATSVHVSWNLTSASAVSVTVSDGGQQPENETEYQRRYELSANVTDWSVDDLAPGQRYVVCVTTVSGADRACAAVALPVQQTTTASPTSALGLSIAATSTAHALHVTWVADVTSGEPVEFRVTWTENGTTSDDGVSTAAQTDRSYTISGLRPDTVYLVCVEALRLDAGGSDVVQTQCKHFSTRPDLDTDNTLLIIIIAAAAGAFLLLILVIVVVVCCCCCCRRRHDDAASTKPGVTVRPAESTRSVNRGSLAQHSVLAVDFYEHMP